MGSYEEEYPLDEVQVAVRDYITSFALGQGQFKNGWDAIGADAKASEASQAFQVPFKTMDLAVNGVAKVLGMAICEGTDKVNVTEKVHNLLLSGMFMGQELVLARGQIGFNQEYGCVLKLMVRSTNDEVSRTVLEAIN